ncbi:hypothetical protein [Treponema sp.]|uniref:hypothetical protein n=1 Tax=Treponema sp. TaxID=166 RepID=UPI00298DAD21|nr:hypothetical protein [Treponema sp.]MCQ2241407.1 hypothetical protein [Treponema sp.]
MNCFYHPEVPAVATCGRCGVALCKHCEGSAYYRLGAGKGQALCGRCSVAEAQDKVNEEKRYLKKTLIKLIICGYFVVNGTASLIRAFNSDGYTDSVDMQTCILITLVSYTIAGLVSRIGLKVKNESLKNQVWNAFYNYEHPISSFLISFIINALFAPFMFIAHLIGYFRTKKLYKNDIEELKELQQYFEL